MLIRRLTIDDAVSYHGLRREALKREPFSFGSSPEDDRLRTLDLARGILEDPTHVVIGAFAPELAGAVGVRRETRLKLRHKAVLWGMYVAASHRRQGIGRRLVEEAIRFARDEDGIDQLHLTVTERASAARALYESLGFVVWGVEPAGLRVEGADLVEHHMVLRL
jgi:GNAT superfamily N-acetyltransferase